MKDSMKMMTPDILILLMVMRVWKEVAVLRSRKCLLY